jgi:hypothetical protein
MFWKKLSFRFEPSSQMYRRPKWSVTWKVWRSSVLPRNDVAYMSNNFSLQTRVKMKLFGILAELFLTNDLDPYALYSKKDFFNYCLRLFSTMICLTIMSWVVSYFEQIFCWVLKDKTYRMITVERWKNFVVVQCV